MLLFLIATALPTVLVAVIWRWPWMVHAETYGRAASWPRAIYLLAALFASIGWYTVVFFSASTQLQLGRLWSAALLPAAILCLLLVLWGFWCLRRVGRWRVLLMEVGSLGALSLVAATALALLLFNQYGAQPPAERITVTEARAYVSHGNKGGQILRFSFASSHPQLRHLRSLTLDEDSWDTMMQATSGKRDAKALLLLREGALQVPWIERIYPVLN